MNTMLRSIPTRTSTFSARQQLCKHRTFSTSCVRKNLLSRYCFNTMVKLGAWKFDEKEFLEGSDEAREIISKIVQEKKIKELKGLVTDHVLNNLKVLFDDEEQQVVLGPDGEDNGKEEPSVELLVKQRAKKQRALVKDIMTIPGNQFKRTKRIIDIEITQLPLRDEPALCEFSVEYKLKKPTKVGQEADITMWDKKILQKIAFAGKEKKEKEIHHLEQTIKQLKYQNKEPYDTDVLELIENVEKRIEELKDSSSEADPKLLSEVLSEWTGTTYGVVWVWQGRFPSLHQVTSGTFINPRYTLVGVTGEKILTPKE